MYQTQSKQRIKNHLSRKFPCRPIYSSVDPQEILKSLDCLELDQNVSKAKDEEQQQQQPDQLSKDELQSIRELIKCHDKIKLFFERDHCVCAFGFENTTFITDDLLKDHLTDPLDLITSTIKAIYYNNQHPENQNTIDLKNNKMKVYRGNKYWSEVQKDRVVRKMIDKALDVIEYTLLDNLPPDIHGYINGYYNSSPEIIHQLTSITSDIITLSSEIETQY